MNKKQTKDRDKKRLIQLIGIFIIITIFIKYPFILVFIITLVLIIYFLWLKYKKMLENKKRQEIEAITVNKIDQMSATEFEKFLNDFFCMHGYQSILTPTTGDFGADLILDDKNGCKIVVQAKLYIKGHSINITAVQQVVAAKKHYNCREAMIITNSYFSEPAKILAKSNNVILWDREQLGKELSYNMDITDKTLDIIPIKQIL